MFSGKQAVQLIVDTPSRLQVAQHGSLDDAVYFVSRLGPEFPAEMSLTALTRFSIRHPDRLECRERQRFGDSFLRFVGIDCECRWRVGFGKRFGGEFDGDFR